MRNIRFGPKLTSHVASNIKTSRKINWDRLIYLMILLAIGITFSSYYLGEVFFSQTQGRVVSKTHQVRLPFDLWIETYYVAEGDQVQVGDTLFSYMDSYDQVRDRVAKSPSDETSRSERSFVLSPVSGSLKDLYFAVNEVGLRGEVLAKIEQDDHYVVATLTPSQQDDFEIGDEVSLKFSDEVIIQGQVKKKISEGEKLSFELPDVQVDADDLLILIKPLEEAYPSIFDDKVLIFKQKAINLNIASDER
ncbi:HlyD family secretion protein [Penaeicola halotolerans]|uniref:HlyD family secretion protein n=1 Tax=Penaeicola halotolerans TaxID=2793196 RepID=UPI001CF804C1|nr:HlyD family secretion protein [Penaeicola halotolerans]